MKYLKAEHVIYINATQVGPDMLRDRGLLEAAVDRPRQAFGGEDLYPTIHDKAAALTQSLIQNHPFIDGNKRTALLSSVAFYGVNGHLFEAPETDAIHLVVDVATHVLPEVEDISQAMARYVRPIPDEY